MVGVSSHILRRTSYWSRRPTRQVLWAYTCLVVGGPLLTGGVMLLKPFLTMYTYKCTVSA